MLETSGNFINSSLSWKTFLFFYFSDVHSHQNYTKCQGPDSFLLQEYSWTHGLDFFLREPSGFKSQNLVLARTHCKYIQNLPDSWRIYENTEWIYSPMISDFQLGSDGQKKSCPFIMKRRKYKKPVFIGLALEREKSLKYIFGKNA